MPTRRTPRRRQMHRPQITTEWVQVFQKICTFFPTYLNCLKGTFCLGAREDEHCAACLEHLELSSALNKHFAVPPWQMLPCSFEAPNGLRADEAMAWWAEALMLALDEAAQSDPRNGAA